VITVRNLEVARILEAMVVERQIRGVGKMLVSTEKGAGGSLDPHSPGSHGARTHVVLMKKTPPAEMATGVCDGPLGLWSPGLGKTRGVVGRVDRWKMGCVGIGVGQVVGTKLWGGAKKLGRTKEGAGGLRIANPREARLSIPAVPASPGPDDKPRVGGMMATGLCGGNLRIRFPMVDDRLGVGGCVNELRVGCVEMGEAKMIGGQILGVG